MADYDNHLSHGNFVKIIREILKDADLNVMSFKKVRHQLQQKLNVSDLSDRKTQINQIIMEIISEKTKDNDRNKDQSEVSDDDDAEEVKSKDKQNVSIKRKISKSSSDDDDDDDEDNDNVDNSNGKTDKDEELARMLQEQDSKRVTRNATKRPQKSTKKGANHKTKSNKSKRNIDKSDDSDLSNDDDGPSKKVSYKQTKDKRQNSGYLRRCQLSQELAEFTGEREMPRHEVVKRIWSYVKEKNLLDPKNRQFAIADTELFKIFGRKRIRLFGMMKHLKKHVLDVRE